MDYLGSEPEPAAGAMCKGVGVGLNHRPLSRDEFERLSERRCNVGDEVQLHALQEEIRCLRKCLALRDEREHSAGLLCGIRGYDGTTKHWPERAAEEVRRLTADNESLRHLVSVLQLSLEKAATEQSVMEEKLARACEENHVWRTKELRANP